MERMTTKIGAIDEETILYLLKYSTHSYKPFKVATWPLEAQNGRDRGHECQIHAAVKN